MAMDNRFKKFFAVPVFAAALPILAHAAPHVHHSSETAHPSMMEAPLEFTTSYSAEDAKAMAASMKAYAQRKIAATDSIDEATALSEQARNIRNSLIGGPVFNAGKKVGDEPGAKTAADIQTLLNTLDQNFKAGAYTETDAKVLAAELLMLKPFHGFVFRARNIFETSSGRARAAHAAAVEILRTAATGIDIYLPTEQWKAGFAYSIEPFATAANATTCATDAGWNATCDITNGATFQIWMRKEVLPQLLVLNRTLAGVQFTKPIYVDNKIFFNKADFVSSKDRFVRLGEAERLAMMSGVQAALSGVYTMNAFKFDGLFESFDDLAKVYGFQTAFTAQASTSQARYNAIHAHPNLFRFKKDDPMAPKYMDAGYKALKASLQNAHFAYLALNGHENDADLQANLIDPRLVAPFTRIINTGFQNAYGMMGVSDQMADLGQGDVMSAVVNGEKVTVHMKNFFDHPPASLQDFMPTQFDQANGEWLTKTVDGQPVKYRNYENGRPIGWNYGVYSQYFDGATSGAEVARVSRVLSQSWGGAFLGGPLTMVMF